MDKRILKEIAKRWSKAVLLANDITDEETMELLTQDEQDYILEEVQKIAEKISNKETVTSLNDLIREYYDFD